MTIQYPDQRQRRLYRHKPTGKLVEVLGFITEPAAILRPLKGGPDQTVVCASANSQDYESLDVESEHQDGG